MKGICVIGGALAVALVGSFATAQDPAAVMLGEPAPSLQLEEVRTGETHSIEEFRGSFIVLHFGASW